MTALDVMAVITVLGALGAAGLGLLAHLCWLLVTDPRELWAIAAMFARAVIG